MGALRERIAHMNAVRNEIEEALPTYEELNAKVGHEIYMIEQGHDLRSRWQIGKHQKKLKKVCSDLVESEQFSEIIEVFGRTTRFEHVEQTYRSDFWDEMLADGGTFPSAAWTDPVRHTFQVRRYRVSEFADRELNGGWTVETIRETARQDRADNLLYQDFIAQSETLDFDLYCEERALRAAQVLLNDMHKGVELLIMHCGSDAVSLDEQTAKGRILHLYKRLCITERRQRNENANKMAQRTGTQFVVIVETPLPFDPNEETLEGASKEARLEAAMFVEPLLFACCACHLAAAYKAPQKRFRALVRAQRAGITLLPEIRAKTRKGTKQHAA
jgi:hypothetical protein